MNQSGVFYCVGQLNHLIKPSYITYIKFMYKAGRLATQEKNVFDPGQNWKFPSYFSCMGML